MTQELTELRACIVEQRYDDALVILDELEGMSKKAILQNIESFLVRLLTHLMKNQVEQRLTNSWAASIRDSIIKIQALNLKDNKKSHYIQLDEWEELLETAFDDAVFAASIEIASGIYPPSQLAEMIDKDVIMNLANHLLLLTYTESKKTLRDMIYQELIKLPGGDDWDVQ
ncbi:MAG: hypothetical protein Fur0025_24590 [Oscillatoriaceae cyanobacterium]